MTYAACDGDLDSVKFLDSRGIPIDQFFGDSKLYHGQSPFEAAISNGHLEVVKYLVERGVDTCCDAYSTLPI